MPHALFKIIVCISLPLALALNDTCRRVGEVFTDIVSTDTSADELAKVSCHDGTPLVASCGAPAAQCHAPRTLTTGRSLSPVTTHCDCFSQDAAAIVLSGGPQSCFDPVRQRNPVLANPLAQSPLHHIFHSNTAAAAVDMTPPLSL